jgi:hypothetical protein
VPKADIVYTDRMQRLIKPRLRPACRSGTGTNYPLHRVPTADIRHCDSGIHERQVSAADKPSSGDAR